MQQMRILRNLVMAAGLYQRGAGAKRNLRPGCAGLRAGLTRGKLAGQIFAWSLPCLP